MSWIEKLYETYENCSIEIGRAKPPADKDPYAGKRQREAIPLLPVSHTTMNAQIELTINYKGEVVEGAALEKTNGLTIIPCTEESASRSGKAPVHHPLFDKLQYMAGDYEKYGGEKGKEFYAEYIKDLERWCNSTHANQKVTIICDYLKKRCLIEDLVRQGVLFCDENGKLLEKWNGKKEDTPPIFKAITGSQLDTAVRIRVNIPGDSAPPEVWLDPQVYQDYIDYYRSVRTGEDLCFVSGEWVSCGGLHPKKIVPFEANAKLVSANDSQGFTYRGRFNDSSQVVSLGYEVSQKAHNALRWLIDRQGYVVDKQCFLAWGTKNEAVPPIAGDALSLIEIYERRNQDSELYGFTNEGYAKRLSLALAGYRADLKTNAQVVVMGFQAATPGRLSITFYREFSGDLFIDRVEEWHTVCSWRHTYGVDKETKKRFAFEGAPSPRDIVLIGYGKNCNDKLKSALIGRILCCIVDASPLPIDILRSVVNKASNLIAFEEEWEREKAVSIACALYRKHYFDRTKREGGGMKGEVLSMALDCNERDRSYLYGRLLAVEHYLEQRAMDKWNERETNAMRYQAAFVKHPYRTWGLIRDKLNPYETKLLKKYPSVLWHCQELLREIADLFDKDEYRKDMPLEPFYLLGFDCQMSELRGNNQGKDEIDQDETQEIED